MFRRQGVRQVDIKTGSRVRSAVCSTEVIVVRAAGGEVDLRCGGQPMIPLTETRDSNVAPDAEFSVGSAMGKRYAEEDLGLELLVTKPGAGSLSIGTTPMNLKDAKPLPSSD